MEIDSAGTKGQLDRAYGKGNLAVLKEMVKVDSTPVMTVFHGEDTPITQNIAHTHLQGLVILLGMPHETKIFLLRGRLGELLAPMTAKQREQYIPPNSRIIKLKQGAGRPSRAQILAQQAAQQKAQQTGQFVQGKDQYRPCIYLNGPENVLPQPGFPDGSGRGLSKKQWKTVILKGRSYCANVRTAYQAVQAKRPWDKVNAPNVTPADLVIADEVDHVVNKNFPSNYDPKHRANGRRRYIASLGELTRLEEWLDITEARVGLVPDSLENEPLPVPYEVGWTVNPGKESLIRQCKLLENAAKPADCGLRTGYTHAMYPCHACRIEFNCGGSGAQPSCAATEANAFRGGLPISRGQYRGDDYPFMIIAPASTNA